MSTESEDLRFNPRYQRGRPTYTDSSDSYEAMMADPVNKLTSNLKDTTRNLRSLDRMLDTYKDTGREQRSAIDKLRTDLDKTSDELREEKVRNSMLSSRSLRTSDLDGPSSPSRRSAYDDFGANSDSESPSRRRKKKSGSVRFADDMNRDLHDLHQSVRDLSHDHNKLEDGFSREIDRRDRDDFDARRSLRDITDSLRHITPPADPVSSSVERRLQSLHNDLLTERRLMDRKFDEVGAISSELKHALTSQLQAPAPAPPPQTTTEDWKTKNQLLQSEAVRHRLESELDHVKRKLDHSEGGKSALQQQIDDLKTQLSRADQERSKIKSQLDETKMDEDMRDRRKIRSVEEDKDRERQRFQSEINELRSHLSKSLNASSEVDDLRRSVERSERQRAQLSDHIEALTKDLENREKQNAKYITQLKETADKYEDSDRHKNQLVTQLEDALQRLKEYTREVERLSNELRGTQQQLTESERKKEEFKGRAQETVRQWKLKCKQLEKEADRQKHSAVQMMQRNEHLVKELENMKNHGNAASGQLENIRREMGDILAVRAAQDEQLRLKDVEVNELKSHRMDLDRDLRDARSVAEKLESELRNADGRLTGVLEVKNRLEDQMSSLQAAHLISQDKFSQLEKEYKDLQLMKADLAAQVGDVNVKKQELKMCYAESQHKEKLSNEEIDNLKCQIKEERESHQAVLEGVKAELAELKGREHQMAQDIARRFKKDQAENVAELQALKMELHELRSSRKMARRQDETMKSELIRLHDEIQRYEEENVELRRKVEKAKEEFQTQSDLAEDDLNRVKVLENQLFSAKESVHKLERENLALLNELALDVDAALEVASIESPEKYQAMNSLKGCLSGPPQVLAELKGKIQWIKEEFRDRMKREKKLLQDFRDALTSTDKDHSYFLDELAKKEEALDELSHVKKELVIRDSENINCVETLQDQIMDLTDQLELQKLREKEQARIFSEERQHVIEDIEETQREREKIQDRYLRLQETIRLLQDDLRDSNLKNTEDIVVIHTPKKKVRICESSKPDERDWSPQRSCSRSNSPVNLRSREKHRSPVRLSSSPIRSRSKERLASPTRSRSKERLASPTRSRSKERLASPTRSRSNERLASPTRSRSRERLASPTRSRSRERLASPTRSRSVEDFSPVRSRSRERSSKFRDRQISPIRSNERLDSPIRSRSHERTQSLLKSSSNERNRSPIRPKSWRDHDSPVRSRIPSSQGDFSKTPPPLALSDEDFLKRFLPQTPQINPDIMAQ